MEYKVRFLLIVSSCRHHFLPSKSMLLVTVPEFGVTFTESTGFLKQSLLTMTVRDSVDVFGGSTVSITKISSSNKDGFLTSGLTMAIGDCLGLLELRLDIFRPHDLGVGEPVEISARICSRFVFFKKIRYSVKLLILKS